MVLAFAGFAVAVMRTMVVKMACRMSMVTMRSRMPMRTMARPSTNEIQEILPMGFSTSPHGGKYTKAEVLVGTANEKLNAAIEDRNAPKLADPNILQRNVKNI